MNTAEIKEDAVQILRKGLVKRIIITLNQAITSILFSISFISMGK